MLPMKTQVAKYKSVGFFLLVLLAISSLFVLTGCSRIHNPISTPTPIPTGTTTSDPTFDPNHTPKNMLPVGSSSHTLIIGGETRIYNVYIPQNLIQPISIIVMLHGGGGSADQAEKAYSWDEEADKDGFVVVYPNGLNKTWNAGSCCGVAKTQNIDDVGFITQVTKIVSDQVGADNNHWYLTGMSNGAMMAYRIACETNLFEAIAPVSGTIVTNCNNPSRISLLAIHGLQDQAVPFNGGQGVPVVGLVKVDGESIPDSVNTFAQVDVCSSAKNQPTQYSQVVDSLQNCQDGKSIELITISDAGHQWPGSTKSAAQLLTGSDPSSTYIDATSIIAKFFLSH